ncbi:MAG: DnaD domain protein [Clostridia bacterium]|nr:DnaD domain protein [Clostridia bacterium]
MQYTWSGACAFEMAAIPKAAAAKLKLAGPLQLRVLLWLSCAGQGQFDAARCAAACGGSPEACTEALRYWVAEGLVTVEADNVPTSLWVAPPKEEPTPAFVPSPTVKPSAPVLLPEAATASARPSRTEVLDVQARDERFAFLLHTASEKLGKVLSPADMAVYLHLYSGVGLPPEVILMIIGYAVKNGKARLSYIEKTALNWAEQGITTMDAADAHLCRLERAETAWKQVCEWTGSDALRPTLAQKEAASRWIHEWGFSRDIVVLAVTQTVEKTGKFQVSYTDRILERLHALGITTVEAAKQELTPQKATPKKRTARMKTAEDRAPSFDIGDYESLALRHRPRPPKQEE